MPSSEGAGAAQPNALIKTIWPQRETAKFILQNYHWHSQNINDIQVRLRFLRRILYQLYSSLAATVDAPRCNVTAPVT